MDEQSINNQTGSVQKKPRLRRRTIILVVVTIVVLLLVSIFVIYSYSKDLDVPFISQGIPVSVPDCPPKEQTRPDGSTYRPQPTGDCLDAINRW